VPHPLCIDGRCLSVRLSVCLSVCPVPDPKSTIEGCSTLKIGRKEAHDMTRDSFRIEKSNTCRGGNFGAAHLVFHRDVNV